MTARALYLALVVSALAAVSAWAVARPAPPAVVASPGAELSDDDAGAALFVLTDLTPGRAAVRCLTVRREDLDPGPVRLSGAAGGTGLSDFLHLTIEAGAGGRFGDCAGFAGAVVFEGRLADFVRRHGDRASGLAVPPAAGDAATFRFRVLLDDSAAGQGRTATASFAWETRSGESADAEPVPPRREPPAPRRDPAAPSSGGQRAPGPAVPGPASPEPAAPQPRADGDRGRPGAPGGRDSRPGPARGRREPAGAPATGGETAGPRIRGESESLADRVRRLAGAVAEAVAPAAARAAFPLLLLLTAGVFLLIQNRIDRKDPKLALAPLHADPDLPFPPPEGDPR